MLLYIYNYIINDQFTFDLSKKKKKYFITKIMQTCAFDYLHTLRTRQNSRPGESSRDVRDELSGRDEAVPVTNVRAETNRARVAIINLVNASSSLPSRAELNSSRYGTVFMRVFMRAETSRAV